MDINLFDALPVSKPPPENGLRTMRAGKSGSASESSTFEEALRARQKEEKQSQMQAEAAASQSAASTQAANAAGETHPPDETPSADNSTLAQTSVRISGGLFAMLEEGGMMPAIEAGLSAGEAETQGIETLLPSGVAVEEGLPVMEKVDFSAVLEKSLSQSADEILLQPQVNQEVQNEKSGVAELRAEPKAEMPAKTKLTGEAVQAHSVEAQPVNEHSSTVSLPVKESVIPLRVDDATVLGRSLADTIRQITGQMEVSVRQGRSSLRIQLYPQELGGIDIRFASSSKGISVTVYAEQASTGRLLETQLNQLRQSLSEAGVNLAQLNIHHESPSHQSQSGFNSYNPRGRSYSGAAIERGGSELVIEQADLWQNRSLSGVDYRV